ncbi:MAG: ATP synthase F1 subunit delta [Clostridia bacterium]|nr:ATP synthase F1 subunit delta [Clostridia bacterium]
MAGRSEYGRALFLLAKEEGVLDKIKGDLYATHTAFVENPTYLKMLDTPAVDKEEKKKLISESLSGIDEYVVNLVKILAERRVTSEITNIYETYVALYNEEMGIEDVEAVSAVPMTDSQLAALKAKLEGLTGKTVNIKNTVDPAILGGVKLRYEGRQVDGSLKTRLDTFADNLRNLVI